MRLDAPLTVAVGRSPHSTPAPGGGADPCAPLRQPDRVREREAGHAAEHWDVNGAGDAGIQGFATDISVNAAQTVRSRSRPTARPTGSTSTAWATTAASARARSRPSTRPRRCRRPSRPACTTTPPAWSTAATGRCRRRGPCRPTRSPASTSPSWSATDDTGGASHIVFVVRDDASTSDLLFQTSDTTWQAYNNYGGNSLYDGAAPIGRAYKVSYNRPFNTRGGTRRGLRLQRRVPDGALARGQRLRRQLHDRRRHRPPRRRCSLDHKVFLSVGHDEYWSGQQRANVEAARDAGVNLAFFSGNEVYWKTRWETASTARPRRTARWSATRRRTPTRRSTRSPAWTGTWRDPRFSPPADGGRPENALTGTIFTVNGPRDGLDQGPGRDRQAALLAQHDRRHARRGRPATLASRHARLRVGRGPRQRLPARRADPAVDTTVRRHAGQAPATTARPIGTGTATHTLTLYRAPAARWSSAPARCSGHGGSTAIHDDAGPRRRTSDMQQATVNLLADMGVQPATLQARPRPRRRASTDTRGRVVDHHVARRRAQRPRSAPRSPSPAPPPTRGGVVGGVEVSVDGGTTWHPATGRASWTYTWTPAASARSRCAHARSTTAATSERPRPASPCTVGAGRARAALARDRRARQRRASRPSAVELGVKFRTDVAGSITGVRFYKGSQNTGTHVGHLWTRRRHAAAHGDLHRRDGLRLAAGELPEPVPDHREHDLRRVLLRAQRPLRRRRGRLREPAWTARRCTRCAAASTAPTASTGDLGTFPTNDFPTPTTGSTSSSPEVTAVSRPNRLPLLALRRPSPPRSCPRRRGRLSVHDLAEHGPAGDRHAVRQLRRGTGREVPQRHRRLHQGRALLQGQPATPARTSAACGPPPAPAWPRRRSPARRRAAGKQVTFATPVAITANTTYVASYHTDGRLLLVRQQLLREHGRRRAAAARARRRRRRRQRRLRVRRGRLPDASFRSTNYWVDVVFDTTAGDTTPPTVTARTPAPGATGVAGTSPVTATFSEPVQPATVSWA